MSDEKLQTVGIASDESVDVLNDERYMLDIVDLPLDADLPTKRQDVNNSALFPQFSAIKEEVHMVLRLRRQQYSLIKNELQDHFNGEGEQQHPLLTLDDQWNKHVCGTSVGQSIMQAAHTGNNNSINNDSTFQDLHTYLEKRRGVDTGDTITELQTMTRQNDEEIKSFGNRSELLSLFSPDGVKNDGGLADIDGNLQCQKKRKRPPRSSSYSNSRYLYSTQEQLKVRGSMHALLNVIGQVGNDKEYNEQRVCSFKLTQERVALLGSRLPTNMAPKDIIISSRVDTAALLQHALAVSVINPEKLGSIDGDKRSPAVLLKEIHSIALQLVKLSPTIADAYVHKMSLTDLQASLETDVNHGLTSEVIYSRKDQTSSMPIPFTANAYVSYLKYMFYGLSGIFWQCAQSGIVAYSIHKSRTNELVWYDIFFSIITAMQVNTSSFILQWKYAAISRLPSDIIPSHTRVQRAGHTETIPTKELVPGDIMILRKGDIVTADCRITSSSVDQCCSMYQLSGDERNIMKSTNWTDENVFYSQNQLLAGTQITRGSCKVVAVYVGASTILGRCYLAPSVDTSQKHRVTILEDLHELFTYSTQFSIFCVILGFCQNQRWFDPLEAWMHTYTVTFGNAPESMIASVTLGLALALRGLENNSVTVLQQRAIEDLSAVDTLCIELSGGITMDKPVVNAVWLPDTESGVWVHDMTEQVQVSLVPLRLMPYSSRLQPSKKQTKILEEPCTQLEQPFPTQNIPPGLQWIVGVCLQTVERNSRLTNLSPVETAQRNWCTSQLPYTNYQIQSQYLGHEDSCEELIADHDRILYLPNTHRDKMCLSICHVGSQTVAMFRGSQHEVLDQCDNIQIPYRDVALEFTSSDGWQYDAQKENLVTVGQTVPMTPDMQEAYAVACHSACTEGCTVQACGFLILDADIYPADYVFTTHPPNFVLKGAVQCGIVSQNDPIREDAAQVVKSQQDQRVQPVLITGDCLWFAEHIACLVGALPKDTREVRYVTSEQGIHSNLPRPTKMPNQNLVVDGSAVWAFGEGVWRSIWNAKTLVFANISATNKAAVVERLEELRVVGVLGVCLHDTLAMKVANLALSADKADSLKDISSAIVPSISYVPMAVQYCRNVTAGCRQAALHSTQKLLSELQTTSMLLAFIDIPHPQTTMNVMQLDFALDVLPAVALLREKDSGSLTNVDSTNNQNIEHGERLLTRRAIFWVYLMQGSAFTMGILAAYVLEFGYHGVHMKDIYRNGRKIMNDNAAHPLSSARRQDIYRQVKAATLIAYCQQQYITVYARKSKTLPAMPLSAPWKVFDNGQLNLFVLLSLLMLSIVIYAPPFNYFFDIQPPSPWAWVYPLISGFIITFIIEIHKLQLRYIPPNSLWYKYQSY